MATRRADVRYGTGATLVPRWVIAELLQRNPELISRHCTPVACDVRTRSLLYDVDDAEAVLAAVGRWPTRRTRQLRNLLDE